MQRRIYEGIFTKHLTPGEANGFAIRYIVLTLLWLVPCLLILMGLTTNAAYALRIGPNLNITRFGFTAFIFLTVYIVFITAPLFSALIATYTDTVGELFSMCVISVIARKISYRLGFMVMSFFYSAPMMLASVLVGRACGAFVCGGESIYEGVPEAANPVNPAATSTHAAHTPASAPSAGHTTSSAVKREKINDMEASLIALDEVTIKEEFQSMVEPTDTDEDPSKLFKYAYLALKNDQEDNAYKIASKVIELTIQQAAYLEAATCFKHFKAHKNKLMLETPTYKTLARAVANMNDFTDATWLIYQHITKANAFDDVALQKQILHFADEAERAHLYADAFAVYNLFVSNFGTSTFCQFAQDRANDVKNKLG